MKLFFLSLGDMLYHANNTLSLYVDIITLFILQGKLSSTLECKLLVQTCNAFSSTIMDQAGDVACVQLITMFKHLVYISIIK